MLWFYHVTSFLHEKKNIVIMRLAPPPQFSPRFSLKIVEDHTNSVITSKRHIPILERSEALIKSLTVHKKKIQTHIYPNIYIKWYMNILINYSTFKTTIYFNRFCHIIPLSHKDEWKSHHSYFLILERLCLLYIMRHITH